MNDLRNSGIAPVRWLVPLLLLRQVEYRCAAGLLGVLWNIKLEKGSFLSALEEGVGMWAGV
ncbi:MAG: hypothetical protein ACP5R4_08300 [Armatimonadota bacterium]